jgi:hypothetical protein
MITKYITSEIRLGLTLICLYISFGAGSLFATNTSQKDEINRQLSELESQKKAEILQAETNIDAYISALALEVEALKAVLTKHENQLELAEKEQASLRFQVQELQASRDTIESSYKSKAESLAKKKASEAKSRYDALKTAAKLLNDAIVSQNLQIGLVPETGATGYGSSENLESWQGTLFENREAVDLIFASLGTPEYQVGKPAKLQSPSLCSGLAIVKAVRKINDFLQVQVTWYPNFPVALAELPVASKFADLAQASTPGIVTQKGSEADALSQVDELNLALQKWDYVNGKKLATLKEQNLTIASKVVSLKKESEVTKQKLIERQAILSAPKSEQLAKAHSDIDRKYEALTQPVKEKFLATQNTTQPSAASIKSSFSDMSGKNESGSKANWEYLLAIVISVVIVALPIILCVYTVRASYKMSLIFYYNRLDLVLSCATPFVGLFIGLFGGEQLGPRIVIGVFLATQLWNIIAGLIFNSGQKLGGVCVALSRCIVGTIIPPLLLLQVLSTFGGREKDETEVDAFLRRSKAAALAAGLSWFLWSLVNGKDVTYWRQQKSNASYKQERDESASDSTFQAEGSDESQETPETPKAPPKTPYEILGISPTSSDSDIKRHYRDLVNRYHPDRATNLGSELHAYAEEMTKIINNAYGAIKQQRGTA